MSSSYRSVYNLDDKSRVVRERFFRRYDNLSLRYRVQIRQRWLGAPYLQIEGLIPKKGTILDLGCGLGNFCHVLALRSKKRKVVGIDFDKKRIDLVKKTIAKDENLIFRFGDLRTMSFEKCDAAVLFDVLHHIDYNFHKGLLIGIYKALRKGGALLMVESENSPKWKYLVWKVWEFVALGLSITRGGSLSLRSRKDLTSMLSKIGFKVEVVPCHQGRLFPHILYVCTK